MPPCPSRFVRCRFCQRILSGWLPIPDVPDGAMLLNHLSRMHPVEVKSLLTRMEREDIGTVAMEAFEHVEAV